MGLKITTEQSPVMVFVNERQTQNGSFKMYSIGVSSKDKDGNWVNGFIDCQFKKGVELNNKAKIEISNSFYTVNEYNGKKYTKLFILDFTVVEDGEVSQPAPAPNGDMGFMNIDTDMDSLPFN